MLPTHLTAKTIAALISLLTLSLYALLTSDFPALEDDGLFILGGYFGGTAHSPGYPLFILISQLFLLLPWGSVAFQIHLVNGVLASLSCALFFLLVHEQLRQSRLVSIAATIGLAFSSLFFQQALVAEAYMLNVFLLLCLFRLSFSTNQHASAGLFLTSGLVYGLSLSNHWPLTLVVAPVLLALYWPAVTTQARLIPWAVLGVVAGMAPYWWMYAAASDNTFSHVGEFASLTAFANFVLRDVYAEVDSSAFASAADKRLFLVEYIKQFATQYSLIALPLVILGFVVQWQALPGHIAAGLSLILLLPVVLVIAVGFSFNRAELAAMSAYPLPLFTVAGIWLAIGMTQFFKWLPQHTLISLAAALLVSGSVVYSNRDVPQQNAADWSADIARSLLTNLPENSILFVMRNWSMAQIAYLQYVEGVRPDVTLYSRYSTFLPNRLTPWTAADEEKSAALAALISGSERPVFTLAPLTVAGQQVTRVTASLPSAPSGTWHQLYYRQLARDNIAQLALMSPASLPNAARIILAEHQLKSDEVNVTETANLLNLDPASLDRFDHADLLRLKGLLMWLLEEQEEAITLMQASMAIWPVSANPASGLLLNFYLDTCQTTQFEQHLAQYTLPNPQGLSEHLRDRCGD